MKRNITFIGLIALVALYSSSYAQIAREAEVDPETGEVIPESEMLRRIAPYPAEKHLSTLVQLTNGGDNAEAYWSFDSKKLIFQSNYERWGVACDQIFILPDLNRFHPSPLRVSTGKGRTTCSYFLNANEVLYASTHLAGEQCPPPPAPRPDRKYLWSIDTSYDIFVATTQGELLRQLTNTPGYDAEATVSPDGKKIVFTSMRNGDLDLYIMDADGSNVKQITNLLGYDGGAFFFSRREEVDFLELAAPKLQKPSTNTKSC